jgi:phytoene synthase
MSRPGLEFRPAASSAGFVPDPALDGRSSTTGAPGARDKRGPGTEGDIDATGERARSAAGDRLAASAPHPGSVAGAATACPRLEPTVAPGPRAGRFVRAAPPRRDVREARTTTKRVARTFSLACRLLPRTCREDVYLLYLVFRTLDDLVDERRPEAAARVDAVATWAAGRAGARTREVTVLEELDARRQLPRDAFAAFCAGMRADLAGAPFATEADVDRYCYRVAGTVGEVMAAVLGTRDDARARPAAAALGMAMQRTNILRDIDEDAAAGRSYLAQEAVLRFGGPEPGARRALLRDQIARAEELYDRGLEGVPLLLHGGPAVRAAAWMYREILRQIERDGYGARAGRAVVPGRRKLWIAARRAVA